MTTVPLAIPLKRQGAGDGALLAFIITSALLGPTSIVLTFAMFGPVWGVLRVRALPLIAVCALGWGLQRFGTKLHSGYMDSKRRASGVWMRQWRFRLFLGEEAVLFGLTLLSMIRNIGSQNSCSACLPRLLRRC